MKEIDKSWKGTRKLKAQSGRYFQLIAQSFLKERGAPFFLSSKDLDLISTWENLGIPLQVVLEGIERTFESYRTKKGARRRVRTLGFCNHHVLRAFEQYRERKIGSHGGRYGRDDKIKRIESEVQRFLKDIPSNLSYLEEIYFRALKMLSRGDVKDKDEELERIEEETEELLFQHCPQEEKEKLKREILEEYPLRGEEELLSLLKIKVGKFLREKHEIPYISFFYY
ncbi:MAG: hypothetical protein ACETWK_12145 [Candidatus Aminicenantaceae bacterium]